MILSLSVLTLSERTPLDVDTHDLLCLAGFGALQLAGGMLLFTYGVRLIPAAESALLSVIESVRADLGLCLLRGARSAILGSAIVLGTVIVYTSLDLLRRARPAAIG